MQPQNNNNPFGNRNNLPVKPNKPKNNNSKNSFKDNKYRWLLVAVLLIVVSSFFVFSGGKSDYKETSTAIAYNQIDKGNVEKASISDKEQILKLDLKEPAAISDKPDSAKAKKIVTQYPARSTEDVFNELKEHNVNFDTVVSTPKWWMGLLSWLPMILLFGFFIFMSSRMQGGAGGIFGFAKSKAKLLSKDDPETKFMDVAGEDEAVEELEEIKDFLKNPAKYQALGAKIPRGVLLYGPPGTGKTLLAKAVAGEAGVPFYSISGSDFVEMFVGVGASRVRDLFEQAKQNSPCIVFVDEIDAVGRQRGAGFGGGHDEREQTLNQLLVEMDGFNERQEVIVMAATNRPDVLDPALLRPGRFDRQVPVSNPDMAGRKAILEVHAKGKPFTPDVDFSGISKRTPGMSGADLANVINEAALLTARFNQHVITPEMLEEAVDRVVGGPRRKNKVISELERKIAAYHESGHTIAAWATEGMDPIYKVTILARGRTGGHALAVPEQDKDMLTRHEIIGRIVMAMGGRAAEELVFRDPSTGASSDIDQATKMARAMLMEYGMSSKLGAVRYAQEDGDPFSGQGAGANKGYSPEVAAEIDKEVKDIIDTAQTEAWAILTEYRDVLDKLAGALLEKETLVRKDLEAILGEVKKRPAITKFDDYGKRVPSDKPPIATPREKAEAEGREYVNPNAEFKPTISNMPSMPPQANGYGYPNNNQPPQNPNS